MPGILWGSDFDRLRESVRRIADRFGWTSAMRFVEIGIHEGRTSRALIEELRSMDLFHRFFYYGIDPGVDDPTLGEGFIFLQVASHEAIHLLPSNLHWVWIDGCHCAQCVERDFTAYSARIVLGGEICFHDASPGAQGRDPQLYPIMEPYHDVERAAGGIAVRQVLDSVLAGRGDFRLVQAAPIDQEYGGIEIYQKVRYA